MSEEKPTQLEWYKTAFGEELKELQQLYPILQIEQGKTIEAIFLEDAPRIANTRYGQRPVIDVLDPQGQRKALFLSAKTLAIPVARLQTQYGSLRGIKVAIYRPTGGKGDRYYKLDFLERIDIEKQQLEAKLKEIWAQLKSRFTQPSVDQLEAGLKFHGINISVDQALQLLGLKLKEGKLLEG